MEDISRELEREIARSKPKPYKQDRKTRILIVDDFGQMKSGEYLRTFVTILFIISIVCFVTAGVFYYLYTGLSRDTNSIKTKLVLAETKVDELTREKEMLMARLVISGKDPGIEKVSGQEDKPEDKIEGRLLIAQVEEKKPLVSKNQEIKSIPTEPEEGDIINKPSMADPEKNIIKPKLNTIGESPEAPVAPETPKAVNKTVSIEKFTVIKDGTKGDLLVRFDIRNISKEPGDVSGRIFTVLKPDNKLENQWLVVPAASLKNGIPSEYRKGQYFSIAHFKPVKFRIKSHADPDFFKKASIFIFNEQADLIFEKLIDITEAK
ncbi:MAG: hypothetical protein KAQ72_09620 [Desulfobacula sp.]|nr:hypothetical protein [Desulfobacula sp.]